MRLLKPHIYDYFSIHAPNTAIDRMEKLWATSQKYQKIFFQTLIQMRRMFKTVSRIRNPKKFQKL